MQKTTIKVENILLLNNINIHHTRVFLQSLKDFLRRLKTNICLEKMKRFTGLNLVNTAVDRWRFLRLWFYISITI